MAKPKQPRKRRSIDDQILDQEQKLKALKIKAKIEESDNPKDVKKILNVSKIVRSFGEEDVADELMRIVGEMCDLDDDEDADE